MFIKKTEVNPRIYSTPKAPEEHHVWLNFIPIADFDKGTGKCDFFLKQMKTLS